jgi:hypothetical protein
MTQLLQCRIVSREYFAPLWSGHLIVLKAGILVADKAGASVAREICRRWVEVNL